VLVEQLSHAITMHVLTLFAFFMATGAQPTQQIHMAAFRIITSNVFMHQVLAILILQLELVKVRPFSIYSFFPQSLWDARPIRQDLF